MKPLTGLTNIIRHRPFGNLLRHGNPNPYLELNQTPIVFLTEFHSLASRVSGTRTLKVTILNRISKSYGSPYHMVHLSYSLLCDIVYIVLSTVSYKIRSTTSYRLLYDIVYIIWLKADPSVLTILNTVCKWNHLFWDLNEAESVQIQVSCSP